MIDAAIESGIADPDRIAIAGHGQGGFLAAWGVTVSQRFKAAVVHSGLSDAAVVHSGLSDWGSLSLLSDMPDFAVCTPFCHACIAPVLLIGLPTL
jgi:acetyl esterase/lipase